MPTVFNSAGVSLELGAQIGRGGEGTVFAVPVEPTLVGKLYHEPIDDEKAEKLRWMAANKNEQLLKTAAWIVETLHESPDGRIVGFLMPNVRAKEIHELYSLKSRRVHFPEATWKFLTHAAANVARAFYSLHKNNHVMGDVNHGNCVVLRDGTVKLIDCDSYSISRGDFRYRCEVGVATHLAPELQGLDLSEVEREVKHDNFGLAVIIFQLLFLGRHPFAGMYLGPEDKSLEECIRERRFAYTQDSEIFLVKRPPGTLSLDSVSPRIASMFDRAFLTEDRPEAKDWIEALEDLSDSLVACGNHPGHHYYKELAACPWCGIEAQTGLMLFPFVSSARTGDDEFDIFTVESLIQKIGSPRNLPSKPYKALAFPPPDEAISILRGQGRARFLLVAALHFSIVLFLSLIGGPAIGFLLGAVSMTVMIIVLNNTSRSSKAELEAELEAAEMEWNKIENDWTSADIVPQFEHDLSQIREKLESHKELRLEGKQREKALENAVLRYKLDSFLANHKLDSAPIHNIEPSKLQQLHALGVRSAADVNQQRFKSLPPIEEDVVGKLVEWRKQVERDFVFNPNDRLPAADLGRLEDEFRQRRHGIERDIDRLLGNVRAGSMILQKRHDNLEARANASAGRLAQCESNIKAAGGAGMAIIVLIIMTVVLPIVVAQFQVSKPPSPPIYKPPPAVKAANPDVNPKSGYRPPERLSDAEIASMTESQKIDAAEAFLSRGKLNLSGSKFKAAELDLTTAEKLAPGDDRVLGALGELNYQLGRYRDAVAYLNRALAIDSSDTTNQFALGKTFMKMRYFEDSRRVFAALANDNPRDFYVQFNLGLACKELGQTYAAVGAFREAVDLMPTDADAHYELAVGLNKIGSVKEVKDQYDELVRLNPKLAAKLKKELDLKIP